MHVLGIITLALLMLIGVAFAMWVSYVDNGTLADEKEPLWRKFFELTFCTDFGLIIFMAGTIIFTTIVF